MLATQGGDYLFQGALRRPGLSRRIEMGKKASRFAECLGAELRAREMGQQALADTMGTSQQYVSALANGRKPASPERIEAISDALKLDVVSRSKMHRAAATDLGFRLDLPDDFDE